MQESAPSVTHSVKSNKDNRSVRSSLRKYSPILTCGANLQTGGRRHGVEEYYIEPTIFSDITDEMKFAKEEIFGPVMSIIISKLLILLLYKIK